ANDRILEINGQKLYTSEGIYDYMKDHPAASYTLTVRRNGKSQPLTFEPGSPKIGSIVDDPNSPARKAKLEVGDVVTGADDAILKGHAAYSDYFQKHGGKKITLHIERNGGKKDLTIIPEVPVQTPDESKKPKVGIGWKNTDGIVLDGMGIIKLDNPDPIEQ